MSICDWFRPKECYAVMLAGRECSHPHRVITRTVVQLEAKTPQQAIEQAILVLPRSRYYSASWGAEWVALDRTCFG